MKELTLEITQKCMNNCIYCSSNSNKYCKMNINFKKIKSIIDEAVELGFTNINLSGGEPFLHKDIISICKFIKSKGLYLTVYSSGIYCSNEKLEYIPINILKECNIDTIIFNMQSSNNEHYKYITNSIHGNSLLFNSIKNCIKLGINTEINFVPMSVNINDFYNVINACKMIGVNKINVLKLVVQGRCNENLIPSKHDIDSLFDKIKQVKGISVRIGDSLKKCDCNNCKAGKDKAVIRYDGQVLSCERFKMITNKDNINIYSLKECIQNIKERLFYK